MDSTTRREYAPRTRSGLLVSCTGFALLAATPLVPGVATAIEPVMGLGFVTTILVIVHLPRLIRPGSTWSRARLSRNVTTMVYASSATAALISLTVLSAGWTTVVAAVATGAVVLAGFVAAVSPPEDRQMPS